MTEKQCTNCEQLNSDENNFCSSCGFNEFREVPAQLAGRLAGRPEITPSSAVRISIERVVLLTVLSSGLYLFYWFYLTWKQLASETGDEHRPVWHALTLFIPIYNLFRMHAHVRVIGELAERRNIQVSLSPVVAVILLFVGNALSFSSFGVDKYIVLIVMSIIAVMLTTVLVTSLQSDLNRYWEARWPNELSYARIGVGEIIFVVLGIIAWIFTFIPASTFE